MLYIGIDFGVSYLDFAPMLVKLTIDSPKEEYTEWIPIWMFYEFNHLFSEC